MMNKDRKFNMDDKNDTVAQVSRRAFVRYAALAGTMLATLGERVDAQIAGSGAYSNSAIAGIPGTTTPGGLSPDAEVVEIKIKRAMMAGPAQITRDATVVDMNAHGQMVVLRKGTNHWVCMPGDENKIGHPPMCVDSMAMQWFMDAMAKKEKPTNSAPGLAYMLCGATQHSNTDAMDNASPAIPIGPHWMIMWPFNAKLSGLPSTVRDAGAWVMFDNTPYAYLHVCGSPWVGNEYVPGETTAVWTMEYAKS
jgi:hypothetical protein